MNWLLFTILSLMLAYLGTYNGKVGLAFRILLICFLAYAVGFGGSLSRDHYNYALFYHLIGSRNFSDLNLQLIGESREVSGFEMGFVLLAYVANLIHLGEAGFFFVVALITNTLFVKVIYKNPLPIVSVFLYISSLLYIQETNLVRQILAAAIFVYGLNYLLKGENKKYIITCLISGLFHTSGFMMALFVFLNKVNWEKNRQKIILGLLALWGISFMAFYNIIHIKFFSLLSFVSYYEQYLVDDIESATSRNAVLLNDIYVLISFIYLFKIDKNVKPNYYILLLPLVGILMNFSTQFYWFYRLAYFFFPLVVFCVPQMLCSLKVANLSHGKLLLGIFVLRSWSEICSRISSPEPPLFFEMYSFKDFVNL